MPHFHPHGAFVFITWRVSGSLPGGIKPAKGYATPGRAFAADDRLLDCDRSGPMWLECSDIADLVAEAIIRGERDTRFYELGAWSVMPNHVHLLVLPAVPVRVFMRWLKGSTSRRANEMLERTGQRFWQAESFDHWVRTQQEFERVARYIEQNPVTAGLVASAELWRWSSAGWQAKAPALPRAVPVGDTSAKLLK